MQYLILQCIAYHEWKKFACKQMSQVHRINQIIKNQHIKNKKYSFEFILIQFFKTWLFVKTCFYLFQTPVFFIFLNTIILWEACNQPVAPGITRPSCMLLVVKTTDLIVWKIFELLWFDKLHVEINLVCSWSKLWWFLFVGYLNKCWILLQNSNCSCVATLSVLVIVNFSVTARCALYHFCLEQWFLTWGKFHLSRG